MILSVDPRRKAICHVEWPKLFKPNIVIHVSFNDFVLFCCFISIYFSLFLFGKADKIRFQGDLNDILLSNQLKTKIKFRVPKTFNRIHLRM